jgi:hypothetical protein
MHLDQDLFVRLNATARLLWDELAQPRSIEALAVALASRFPAAGPRAREDVEEFVRKMADRGLLLVS